MPLDPDRLREANDRAQSLSKRFDAFVERRKINDSEEDEDEDVDIDPAEETSLVEPARAALEATPGSDLRNPEIEDEPWFK